MVEKKSVASLANTSFIVAFLVCCHCEERGDEAIQSVLRASGLLRFARNDESKISRRRQRGGGGFSIFRPPVRRIPFCKIRRAVAGGYADAEAGPERQAGYIDRQQVRDQHQHESKDPCPGDDVID